MLWALITKYQIEQTLINLSIDPDQNQHLNIAQRRQLGTPKAHTNSEHMLLFWCQGSISKYRNVSVSQSLPETFANGMAFCAMIHSRDPSLIDYDSLNPVRSRS